MMENEVLKINVFLGVYVRVELGSDCFFYLILNRVFI